jgi:hypothetical protein
MTQTLPRIASHISNPESHAARMSLLRVAVRKVPFSMQELRKETPEILAEIVRGQVRRLESEGLITRLGKGVYVATCVAHTIDPNAKLPEQNLSSLRMPENELIDYLSEMRTIDDVKDHFDLSRDATLKRLRTSAVEGRILRKKIGNYTYYTVSKEALQNKLAEYEADRERARQLHNKRKRINRAKQAAEMAEA